MSTTSVTGTGTVQTGSNGSSYITGISTGLNTEQLIDAGYNQKLQPYTALQTEITNNTNIISSYSTLQTLSQTLSSAFDQLQSVTQSADESNVFDSKSIAYTASDSSSGSNIVTATTSSGATSGTHQVVVKQLAQGLSVTSDSQLSATAQLNYNGVFNIGETGQTNTPITVTGTESLTDIKNAINATTTSSGVKADILQIAGGGYKLVITSNDTAQSFTATATSGDDILQKLGVNKSDGTFKNVSQVAQQADFFLDGTEILSNSNTLNDVLTGLDLQLNNAAPGTTVTITLSNNTAGVTNAVNAFVSAYNALRSNLDSLQKTNADGTVATGAYLANDPLTRSFQQSLLSSLTQSYNGSSYYSGLGAIGITIDSTNSLVVDTTALSTALTSHFSDVQSLFQTANGTPGLADSVYTLLNNYSNSTTGQFVTQSNTLTSTDTDLQSKATDYLDTANDYKTYLINKYAATETAVGQSQTTLAQIKALMNSGNSNN